MSNISKKFLAEAFEAYVNEGDIAKATRLFQHHWNAKAKECFALCEAEDEDFDMTELDSGFEEEIANDAGSDKDSKFEQLQIAVDELEDKFPAEETEEIQARFDELRNAIDERKLAEPDDELSSDDVTVIIEDLKADFEANGELSEEVQALFDEISSGLQGDEPEVDVADADETSDAEVSDEELVADDQVEECGTKGIAEADGDKEPENLGVDVEFDGATNEEETPDEKPVETSEDADGEDESDDLDIIYDAKTQAKELLAKLDELEANEKAEEGEASDEEAPVSEGFEKAKLPRNKLQNEEEGVKTQSMKFAAKSSVSLNNKMNVAKTNSAGESADKKVKVEQAPQGNGVKSWTKVAKPENNAKDAKSVLG